MFAIYGHAAVVPRHARPRGRAPARGDVALVGDEQTARQHIMFGRGGRPMLAKTLAGEDTFAPPFIV